MHDREHQAVVDEQIAACQKPKLAYLESHLDAQRRLAAGERQTYCGTCRHWQLADQRCPLFVAASQRQTLERRPK